MRLLQEDHNMQIYKKILVTMDCSEVDGPIVEHVTALALQNSAQVVLLHVVHAHSLDQDRVMHDKAVATLDACLADLQAKGVRAHTIVKSGEPDAEILSEIEEGGYDLVAMATHGHRLIGDILFGSVSESLKHKIRIPLLLLRSGN
jgi:nucleotide-binding universal stress UspA family protein